MDRAYRVFTDASEKKYMKQNLTGFAIIGTGAIAHVHASVIQSIPEAKLIGVYNRTFAKGEDFSKQYDCIAYSSLEAMLKNDEISIVCICSASGAHLEAALASINAGKHCLIEKPLEISTERCEQIIQAAETRGVRVATIFPSRFHPASQEIKQALNQGRFGNLVFGSAYVKWSRDEAYYNSAPWRGTWRLDGGGVLMNQGIHALDLLQWYMGPVESVYAQSTNRRHLHIEVEDTIVANIKFTNGALGSIECTTAAYPGSLKKIEITGTTGSVVLEENNILTWQFQEQQEPDERIRKTFNQIAPGGGADQPMNISHTGHQMQIESFLESIARGVPSLIEGRTGSISVAIIQAIYQSARTEMPVKLEHSKPLN